MILAFLRVSILAMALSPSRRECREAGSPELLASYVGRERGGVRDFAFASARCELTLQGLEPCPGPELRFWHITFSIKAANDGSGGAPSSKSLSVLSYSFSRSESIRARARSRRASNTRANFSRSPILVPLIPNTPVAL